MCTGTLSNSPFGQALNPALAAAVNAPSRPLDPDLRQSYERATRTNNGRGAMPSTQMAAARDIQVEQQRRDDLRAANERLSQQRQAAMAQVAEKQGQAEEQQQAEIQRQGELQRQVDQDRLAQEQQIGRERMAGQAMSQSMQVLGRAGKSTAAPAAQVTRGTQSRSAPRATSGSQGLRIGSAAAAPGTGLNIGG